MGHSTAEMRAYARRHGPILAVQPLDPDRPIRRHASTHMDAANLYQAALKLCWAIDYIGTNPRAVRDRIAEIAELTANLVKESERP